MKKLMAILLVCLFLAGCGAPSPAETVAYTESLTLYLPDGNAEKLEPSTVMVPAVSEVTILEQLKWANVLDEAVWINRFTRKDGVVSIDFIAAFSQQVNSMGTAGETMILGSVVNSFLTAFDADTVTITVDGEVLETGHNVYDFPLSFYE